MTRRILTCVVGIVTVAGLGTACDYRGASSLPLPGAVGTDGYRVTLTFDDATNLVERETCRTNDVVVGTVDSIELDDQLHARVVCRIKNDVDLPANVRATLRETSLLGERYVALDPPPEEQPTGTLAHGAVLPLAASHVVPDVEVVFGALSQVLNGSGLASIETINRELSTAFEQSDVGATTRELGHLVGVLDDNRAAITGSLESLDRLAGSLAEQRGVIADALDSVPAGLAVLDRQRPAFVRSLRSLSRLSRVALPLIRRSKASTVADLAHLRPILRNLGKQKSELARSVERLVTYPFPSNTLSTAKGDYAGMFATLSFDIDSFNHLLEQNGPPPPSSLPVDAPGPSSTPTHKPPLLPGLPDLSDIPLLPDLGDLPGLDGVLPGPGGALGRRIVDDRPRTLGQLLVGAS